ncbi:MAG TPA: hypothetical protein VLV25_02660 [Steroidobacteraceae bacterium]|nr:hypothetical protein [Steroidobacteraceae bacterium]
MAGIVFAALYQDEILPPIADKLLLAFTLIFWFGFVTEFYHGAQLQQMPMFAALLATAGTVYVAAVLVTSCAIVSAATLLERLPNREARVAEPAAPPPVSRARRE